MYPYTDLGTSSYTCTLTQTLEQAATHVPLHRPWNKQLHMYPYTDLGTSSYTCTLTQFGKGASGHDDEGDIYDLQKGNMYHDHLSETLSIGLLHTVGILEEPPF
jgi:hypothetical protein